MLTKEQLKEIKELQSVCEKEGGYELKLNEDMLETRDENSKEDFFHYEDGHLVGFLGCYGFGNKIEMTGMVHPDYRRKGIFTKMFTEAMTEVKKREISTVLLNAPSSSRSAKEFLKSIPCSFEVAEYQMKWETGELMDDPAVNIRSSTSKEDFDAEIQLEVACFGFTEQEALSFNQRMKELNSEDMFIIETEDQTAGKIRVSETNGEAWIYGFAVFPELQGKGIGRKALSKVVKMKTKKGLPVFLEVEARNAHALKLYESCGFRSYHSQDYYKYQAE
ncbi:GNAT family N-acetyltransferase [Sutcliffiella horikoshii]|uniref:GNAT family N-acetyltransferase n=1 Tax=Sutcliffiella horikoshii TaxID=79883 RepID=A0A5D4SWW3_9BACI|nr:GNAT family N-acetyltransferase [Sutcliffiella horikoshii]TYS67795.1 GNAT family N-acetyltransferase [Sutcliffiella horikoshii]